MSKKYLVIVIFSSLFLFGLFISFNQKLRYLQKIKQENQIKISQYENLIERDKRRREPLNLPILVYHYVEVVTDTRDTIRKSLSMLPSIFENQLNLLLKNGYQPIKLDDLVNYYNNQAELPNKPIILTFDDGYKDFYTDVFPILTKYQIPATIFITSGFIDYTHNYLTKDQLLEISQSNLIEIGAHGVNHYNLGYNDPQIIKNEILNSKNILETLIARPIKHFAYPYGGYSKEAIYELNTAGYETATTMDQGNIQTYDDRYLLKRIRPGSSTGDYFLSLLK